MKLHLARNPVAASMAATKSVSTIGIAAPILTTRQGAAMTPMDFAYLEVGTGAAGAVPAWLP
jgi:hypothetical protein